MHDRTEWTRGTTGPQTIKGKRYDNLTEFHRPCATCEEPFSIFVTPKIASGAADSNSFGLKNCERHRLNKSTADVDMLRAENEQLKLVNRNLRDECEGHIAYIAELKAMLPASALDVMREQAQKVTTPAPLFPWNVNTAN